MMGLSLEILRLRHFLNLPFASLGIKKWHRQLYGIGACLLRVQRLVILYKVYFAKSFFIQTEKTE